MRPLYRTFRLLSSIDHWVRRRFSPAGLLVLAGLVGAATLGLDTNQTVAYQAFIFLLTLVIVAMASALVFRARVAVRRILPRYGTVGERLPYRLVVRNRGRRPEAGLVALEDLVDPRPTYEEFVETPAGAEAGDNWFDRVVGYPRWQWLIARKRAAAVDPLALPTLPPDGELSVAAELLPLRRGPLRLTGLTVGRPDPLGLFRAVHTVPLPQSVLVLPRRYPIPNLRLPGGRKYQRGGVALAGSVGDSEEFVALRDYRPGDPVRRIHWKSWARVGKPVIREYQDEFFVRHALVLDTFAPGAADAAFEAAVSVAASFACAVRTEDSLLDLLAVGPEAYAFTAGRGVAHAERILEVLSGVRPCGDKPFATLHHLVAAQGAALSGAICVLLAWDAARRAFVDHLDGLGVPALVLVVTDRRPSGADAFDLERRVRWIEAGRVADGLASL
ncbi:MAG: DUF58 domain-containing protein [Candidatus Rokuibacteriota bacterium]